MDVIAGGWQLGGSLVWQSGLPIPVTGVMTPPVRTYLKYNPDAIRVSTST